MQSYAVTALGGPRWQALNQTMRFVGVDLTGADFRLQVRDRPNTPGTPLIDLAKVSTAAAEGVRLISVEAADGVPVSTLGIRINETTMEGMPFKDDQSESSIFAWDMQVTPSGGQKAKWIGGVFVVEAGVTGADNALLSSGYGETANMSRSQLVAGSSTFAIGDLVISVTLAGAQGPPGKPSGPLGAGAVDAETISDETDERRAMRQKLGLSVPTVNDLRSTNGFDGDTVRVEDRIGSYRRLPSPLSRREDNGGDYILDSAGRAWSFAGRIGDIRPDLPSAGQIIGTAARGAAVTIGCIGDSTTDGALTTSSTANPTNGASQTWGVIPAASTNHTDEAPNAWPAVLRQILRDHYGNGNIQVWNGGYGGQSLLGDSYWAAHWYATIFAGNPNYGSAPNLTLIMFGLNDANTGSATMVSDYLRGLGALCGAARGAGSVPVVMLPLSVINPGYSVRQLRELVPAVRRWCRDQGVEMIDSHAASTRYWAINGRVKMAVEVADFVHPGDRFHGFLAGFVATQLCADIRQIRADAEGIGAFEVWADALVQTPTVNLAADARYGAWTNTAGFTNVDQIDAFVWIDEVDYLAHIRMFSGAVSGSLQIADLPRVRVTSADAYRLAEATYLDRRLCLGDRGAPFNYLADLPIELGRLRYGLNRIRVTLPGTTKMACQFESLEFTRSGLPAREYQVRANAYVRDRRELRGRGALTAGSHLELPPESHLTGATSVVSFGLVGDKVEAAISLTGATGSGVNLLTVLADDGRRISYGATKDADGVHAYVTNTEAGSSASIGVVPHPGGTEPASADLRAIYSLGNDLQPQIQLYYGAALVATFKNLGGFTIPVAGRIGGAYSPDAATVTGDVVYAINLLRSAAA
ncbi:SGNH/GDSL hydrolase family protein [Sphingomonas sp. CV7422]|uniref:SGNH/GDSL hydrolase family protein n=1 Tax=Sphingomonas sp. CV7422 TaxID=3018036 RepID=UPI0022FEB757|nr:GDSL-type esterase/lipase family protein [Sphingomonas sp. CV7422]